MSNAIDPTSNDEFSPEPSPDSEVWMKHHPSEHIFKFQVSNNNTILEDAYILQQNPLSDIDPAPLAPKAQNGSPVSVQS